MKFRILPKIHDFSDARGNTYQPGDTVELPEEQYFGLPWLEPVRDTAPKLEKEASTEVVEAAPSVEPAEAQPEKKRRKTTPEIIRAENNFLNQ